MIWPYRCPCCGGDMDENGPGEYECPTCDALLVFDPDNEDENQE